LKVFCVCSVLAAGVTPARAQSTCYTPQGEERRAILDALRAPVSAELSQPVEFVIRKMRVCWKEVPAWAFVDATPQRPGGEPVGWESAGFIDCSRTVQGLLRRDLEGTWSVTESAVCPTDVPWSAWSGQYGAPPELFK
jgi:hypothetical protein